LAADMRDRQIQQIDHGIAQQIIRSTDQQFDHQITTSQAHQIGVSGSSVPPSLAAALQAALLRRLPGLDAQLRMAPRPRMGWDPSKFPDGLRDAAALLLIYPLAGAPHIPLTVRAPDLRQHTGQVSLPGGRVDQNESIEAAALREAAEEIAVDASRVRVVGQLTPLHIPVSEFLLHPVVAISDDRPNFQRAEREVARIIEAPLSVLSDPAIVREERWQREREGATTPVDVPFFEIDGEKVWGATAMVLAEFLAVWRALG
jgi:8-oxo-dGTP pyrophosphatase MutT (NUDIX family)